MDSQQNLLDSRADIEFLPIPTEESDDETRNNDDVPSFTMDMDDTENDQERTGSLTPLQPDVDKVRRSDNFKNRLSFALSVFNLMNVILGSGILGLGEVVKNLGIVLFAILLLGIALLAAYNINLLLHASHVAGKKTYEGLAQLSFGIKGKVVTSTLIVLHCLGAMVSYIYIVKNELPEVIKALIDYKPEPEEPIPFYLTGDFLVFVVLFTVIIPLSSLKDIRFLGYSSAFGMLCMFFFTITVVIKKFSIPCPLPLPNELKANQTGFPFSSTLEIEENQTCTAEAATINARSAYAVPTMLFSFMCHASMLPIYSELRKPTLKKMQKVANISIFNVFTLYTCAALFGYLTFYNRVQSELLLSYSLYNSKDGLIIVARMMVIICVTLSVPLLHYPARKTIIITFFKKPHDFSMIRHLGVMVADLAVTMLLVLFVPNIRDIFGIAGATTSGSLFLLFPSAFFIRITSGSGKSDVRSRYRQRRKWAWAMLVIGSFFLLGSVILIIADWFSS